MVGNSNRDSEFPARNSPIHCKRRVEQVRRMWEVYCRLLNREQSTVQCSRDGSSIAAPYLFGSVWISDTRWIHSRAAAVNSPMHPLGPHY